jgi:peroxiredoxin
MTMKRKNVVSLLLAAVLVTGFAAIASSGRSVDSDVPAPPAIGATIADFTLPDVSGKEQSLKSLKGAKGTALIFIAVQCPVSNAYNERMEKLAIEYKAKGINIIGINSNSTEPADAVKAHAAENHLTFPILKDAGNKVADQLGAERTPEAYLLDADNKLVYHGRIDNSKDPSGVNSSELRDAMDATLGGKPVEKTTAKAVGCTIKRS